MAEYKKFPTDLPAKGDRTVTFVLESAPDDKSQELEVLSSISAGDLARLEGLGYKRKAGAKAKGPEDEDDDGDEAPRRKAPKKAAAT